MSALKILVPIKRVVDYAVKPIVNKTNTGIATSNLKHSLNPFDELSIEEAVRLRERNTKDAKSFPHKVERITAFTAGPLKCADQLKTALAMGADDAIHVNTDVGQESGTGGLEPLDVAKLLKKVVEQEQSNLVILGKQSIDDDAGQTGQMLAALLGWSQATQAAKVEFPSEGVVQVTKEVDGGVDVVRAKLPMVITTDLRLNEPRFATLPNIMKAKKKPMKKTTLEELGITPGNRLKVLKVVEPAKREGGVKVEDVDGMIGKLKELGAL